MLQDSSDGAAFFFWFECEPLIGALVQACRRRRRCRRHCCCCGESQCFSAIRERRQLNANRPIEDGGNYCLAFAMERYLLACHAQLSSACVCVCVRESVFQRKSLQVLFVSVCVLISMSSSVYKWIPRCTCVFMSVSVQFCTCYVCILCVCV